MPKQNLAASYAAAGSNRATISAHVRGFSADNRRLTAAARPSDTSRVPFSFLGHTVLDRIRARDDITNGTVSLGQLESHLWEAANILRGPVDAADFKTYVFPLLFFKRLSDAHDEEYHAALEESGGDDEYALFPQNYRFQIPERCHWQDVRAITTNVGQVLQTAMRGIEKANPETLYGIFGDAQWSNKERLSDSLLRDLIEHFSRIKLGSQAAQADVLGQSYEYLIKKFADATNKKAGEFYTPRSVVRLMVNILDPREGESIYDPACGTGGMLLEAIHALKGRAGKPPNSTRPENYATMQLP